MTNGRQIKEITQDEDEAAEARLQEFRDLVNEISGQPDAERKLAFISRLLKDPDLLESTAAKLGITG